MNRISFCLKRNQIDRGAFAAAMLRHMVQLQTGELTDAEYKQAVTLAGIHQDNGKVDFRGKSIGYLSCLADRIAGAVPGKRDIHHE
jgi:hypothetical protein